MLNRNRAVQTIKIHIIYVFVCLFIIDIYEFFLYFFKIYNHFLKVIFFAILACISPEIIILF